MALALALLLLLLSLDAGAVGAAEIARIKELLRSQVDDTQRGMGIVVGILDQDGRQVIAHGAT